MATELLANGLRVEVIDGDVIRNHLCKDLGFSKRDRDENIRRIAFVSQLLTRNGTVVLVSAISPYRAAREEARRTIGNFVEVYVSTPLAVCELRDPKNSTRRPAQEKSVGSLASTIPTNLRSNQRSLAMRTAEASRSSSKVVAAVMSRLSQEAFTQRRTGLPHAN